MASPLIPRAQDGRSESRSRAVLAVTAAMIASSTVFVVLRLVSRAGIVKRVTPDDYFIIVAWVLAFGLSFSICLATQYGLGNHQSDLLDEQMGQLIRLEYTFSALYNPALMATKTSILVFYLTIARTMKVFKWSTWGVLIVVNLGGLALSMLNIFQCRPLTAIFLYNKPDSATCFDIVTLYLSSAPLNIITDLCILLLPMPVLQSMRLPRKQKWILFITFGFGIFVTAVDVVRVSYLQNASLTRLHDIQAGQSSSTSSSRNQEENDFSWYASLAFMWSAIEVNVGIMCACVPALKPLVTRFLPNFLSDSKHGSTTEKSTLESEEMAAMHRIPSVDEPKPLPHGQDASMDMMEFLTTPDMSHIAGNATRLERTDTVQTNMSGLTHRNPGQFFDFVNMTGQKSLVYLTAKESVRPIVEITIVFFLWGFAYGLLNTLNAQFQVIAHMTTAQTIGIHSAYFGGYLVAPITFGRLILKYWGFKACLMIGFMIYGTGTLVFWPAAVLTSFPAFLVSNFIVGMGLSTLEIAANPFTALCGPPEYAEVRLQLSQAFQACGTVVSPLLAKKALFKNIADAPSLIDVQWTYLAISLFVYILAFVYYIIKMPEATDEELEQAAETRFPRASSHLRRTSIIWWTLGLAVFTQFLYVGAQESVATAVGAYLEQVSPIFNHVLSDAPSYEAIAHTLFAVSRFTSAGLGFWIKPRHQLMVWILGSLVFSILSMQFTGLTASIMVLMVYFFEGPIFSLLFAIPLRGLGKHTRDGSALLTSAIGGGGVLPPIMHAVAMGRKYLAGAAANISSSATSTTASSPNSDYRYSFCVVVAIFAAASIFPIYLNVIPNAKKQVDPTDPHGTPRQYSSAAVTSGVRRLRSSLAKPVARKTMSGSVHAACDGHASEDSSPVHREVF